MVNLSLVDTYFITSAGRDKRRAVEVGQEVNIRVIGSKCFQFFLTQIEVPAMIMLREESICS